MAIDADRWSTNKSREIMLAIVSNNEKHMPTFMWSSNVSKVLKDILRPSND